MHDFDLQGALDNIQRVWVVAITVAEIVDGESGVALRLGVSYPGVLVLEVGIREAKSTPVCLDFVNVCPWAMCSGKTHLRHADSM